MVESGKAHDHKLTRVVLDCSVVLGSPDPETEFVTTVRTLLKKMQTVDDVVQLEPTRLGRGVPILAPDKIPLDHTELGNHVSTQGGLRAFQRSKPWKRNETAVVDENGLMDPEVNFAMAISCDEDPRELLERVSVSFGQLGGRKLFLKKVQAIKTNTPIVVYNMHNMGHVSTLVAEWTQICQSAHDIFKEEKGEDYVHAGRSLPSYGIRVNVPKIKGQDTRVFENWSREQQFMRKAVHFESDRDDSDFVQDLMEKAKLEDLIRPLWGVHVKVSKTSDNDTEPQNLNGQSRWVKKHVNYHASMVYGGLTGIVGLDKKVPIHNDGMSDGDGSEISLRDILYTHVKMPDGTPLFAEVHQEHELAAVQVVHPNTLAAEVMIQNLCKHPAVFLTNYLPKQGIPKDTVAKLVEASICPTLLHTMGDCTWNEETNEVTTPVDVEDELVAKMESQSWYQDVFTLSKKPGRKGKKEKSKYANPEALYDLDGQHSVETLHDRPSPNKESNGWTFGANNAQVRTRGGGKGKDYAGDPGQPSLDLGKKPKGKDKPSKTTAKPSHKELSKMTKPELLLYVSKMQEAQASSSASSTGSAPDSADDTLSDGSSSEEDTSSSDSSGSTGSGTSSPSAGTAGGRQTATSG